MNTLLMRRVTKVIDEQSLAAKLASGKPLTVYFGVDITSPTLHIGSAVGLFKLEEFADAGHRAILLFGDFTTLIGDPSGHDKSRPMLDEATIKQSIAGWEEQVGRFIDLKKFTIRRNSEWLGNYSALDLLKLADHFSAADIWERNLYKERLKQGQGLTLREFLYPLLQAIDAVELKADVQIGGSDQEFNILRARELVKKVLHKDQDMVLTPLLPGTDGRKMSKSWGNTIAVDEQPQEMFGKVMRIPDEHIRLYAEAATRLTADQLLQLTDLIERQPKEAKLLLAQAIVETFHSKTEAKKARDEFEKVFAKGNRPSDIPTVVIKDSSSMNVVELLLATKLVTSKSEARRLISQGGVRINDAVVTEVDVLVEVKEGIIVSIGKRRVVKLSFL